MYNENYDSLTKVMMDNRNSDAREKLLLYCKRRIINCFSLRAFSFLSLFDFVKANRLAVTMVDCGCPDTCDASALAENYGGGTCGEQIEIFMKGGFSEEMACTMASRRGEHSCAFACHPKKCQKSIPDTETTTASTSPPTTTSKTASTTTTSLLPESVKEFDNWGLLGSIVLNVLFFLIIIVVVIKRRRGSRSNSSHKKDDTPTSEGVFRDNVDALELSRPYTDQNSQPRNIPSNEVFQVQKSYLQEISSEDDHKEAWEPVVCSV